MFILLQKRNLRAQILRTRRRVPSSRLGIQCLAVVRPQPRGERLERIRDVVCYTFRVCATVITVEIFVDVEDQIRGAAVWVRDFEECGSRSVRDELAGRGVIVSW